jgi:integrase
VGAALALDLRHVFGSHAINKASILQVQNWMGHADVKTTMRYLHHKSHASDADLLDEAASAAPSWEPRREVRFEDRDPPVELCLLLE